MTRNTQVQAPHTPKLHVATVPYISLEVNPHAESGRKSLSGVSHESVLSGLDHLYPPQDLHMCNAASLLMDTGLSFLKERNLPWT